METAIADAIALAERILSRIDARWTVREPGVRGLTVEQSHFGAKTLPRFLVNAHVYRRGYASAEETPVYDC